MNTELEEKMAGSLLALCIVIEQIAETTRLDLDETVLSVGWEDKTVAAKSVSAMIQRSRELANAVEAQP